MNEAVLRTRIQDFKTRVLADTGILCRELLGYNYDEDENLTRTNVGSGGIRSYGKTQEIIELLDDQSTTYKLVMAPRAARKSTMAQGLVIRHILKNPNIRVLYVGRSDDIVLGKARAIRAQLERQEITELFGEQQGEQWGETKFTVRGRTNSGLQNPTFTAFSQDSMETGGRFDLIVSDDFIDEKNVTNKVQNLKSKERFSVLQPMLAPGGIMVVLCTLWADDDLSVDLQSNPLYAPPYGGQVVCGAGVRVIYRPDGRADLEVVDTGLTFPHLTLDHLRQKLWSMSVEGKIGHFCRQYLNEATSFTDGHFQRKFFKSLQWGPDMQKLSGYLLTDTAISDQEEGCYSVCAYVGIDASDNIYVLDLRVGHWSPADFCDNFFTMLEAWHDKVNHCGEAWENVALATAYRHQIEVDSRARKLRLRTIEMPRPASSAKQNRINRLQPSMRSGHFYVVSTVPRSFVDLSGPKVLWDPVGHFDAGTKNMVPSGELVDEFIKATAKKDIADTISMILEYQKTRNGYKRYCTYKPWKPPVRSFNLTQERREQYHREEYEQSSTDWWQQTLHEQGF